MPAPLAAHCTVTSASGASAKLTVNSSAPALCSRTCVRSRWESTSVTLLATATENSSVGTSLSAMVTVNGAPSAYSTLST